MSDSPDRTVEMDASLAQEADRSARLRPRRLHIHGRDFQKELKPLLVTGRPQPQPAYLQDLGEQMELVTEPYSVPVDLLPKQDNVTEYVITNKRLGTVCTVHVSDSGNLASTEEVTLKDCAEPMIEDVLQEISPQDNNIQSAPVPQDNLLTPPSTPFNTPVNSPFYKPTPIQSPDTPIPDELHDDSAYTPPSTPPNCARRFVRLVTKINQGENSPNHPPEGVDLQAPPNTEKIDEEAAASVNPNVTAPGQSPQYSVTDSSITEDRILFKFTRKFTFPPPPLGTKM